MHKTVTIIAGFLGAGKTTLLNHLLSANLEQRVAVLVNDFGAINVDAQLIVGVQGEIMQFANGCVCCTIRDDLQRAVTALLASDDTPDHIIVETSGVSDPLAVARTFNQMPVRIDGIITVIDAEHLPTLKGQQKLLALDQLTVADLIVLNKTDLVTARQLATLRRKWLYPGARVIETTHAQVSPELLLGIRHESDLTSDPPHDHRHDQQFSTWHWTTNQPIPRDKLMRALRKLPPAVFRLKGIVQLDDKPERRTVVQVVGKRIALESGDDWGDAQPQSQLVAIGVNLDAAALERQFARRLTPAKRNIDAVRRIRRLLVP